MASAIQWFGLGGSFWCKSLTRMLLQAANTVSVSRNLIVENMGPAPSHTQTVCASAGSGAIAGFVNYGLFSQCGPSLLQTSL